MEGKHTMIIAKQLPGYQKIAFKRLLNRFEELDRLDFLVQEFHKLGYINTIEELISLLALLWTKGEVKLKKNTKGLDL